MATTLTSIGSVAGTPTGGAVTPTVLGTLLAASGTALTTGTGVQFNWANNGAMLLAVDVTSAAGGFTGQFTLQKSILGFSFAATAVQSVIPSTAGIYLFGPFGPSNFNDSNGLCWFTQSTASASTVFIGVLTAPGALS